MPAKGVDCRRRIAAGDVDVMNASTSGSGCAKTAAHSARYRGAFEPDRFSQRLRLLRAFTISLGCAFNRRAIKQCNARLRASSTEWSE